jgi:hypothetical protein
MFAPTQFPFFLNPLAGVRSPGNQPPTTTMNAPTGIEAEVIKDIVDRQRLGIAKYGCTVAESLDDMCQHAYEEALDLAIYLKAELIRRANDPNYKHYTHHQQP